MRALHGGHLIQADPFRKWRAYVSVRLYANRSRHDYFMMTYCYDVQVRANDPWSNVPLPVLMHFYFSFYFILHYIKTAYKNSGMLIPI